MKNREFHLLDMLSLVYEDMDIDAIEEKFVNIVSEIFSFDRVGLLFIKHRKEILQGKLCKGFEPGTISSINIPVSEKHLFTRPLVTGFPLWGEDIETDSFNRKLGLTNFAIIPIVNQKRVSCWRLKNCVAKDCPAYGKNNGCAAGWCKIPSVVMETNQMVWINQKYARLVRSTNHIVQIPLRAFC